MVTYVYIIYIYWSVVSVDVGIIIRPTCVVNVPNTSRASLFLFFVGKAGKPTWLHPEDLRFEALKKKRRRRRRRRRKKERNKERRRRRRRRTRRTRTRTTTTTTTTTNPSEILPVSKYHVHNRESR